MPAASRMWSPKSSPRSKSRTGGRRSARCCCIESPKEQRSSSASPLVSASTNTSRNLARPPKPSRSRSESHVASKSAAATHKPLTPPLLYGVEQNLAENHTLTPDAVFATPIGLSVDGGKPVRHTNAEVESIHASPADEFRYEEKELVKLQRCTTCKQAWRAAFDLHREQSEQANLLEQAVEKEKLRTSKAKKAVLRERAKLAKMEAEYAEQMESLRGALKQEQISRQEAEEKLECERKRCAAVLESFETVKTQFETMQVVFQELQPLLGQLALGIVMETHSVQNHIEELTKTAVDRLMSFSDLAEKTQELFSSSEEDLYSYRNTQALPSTSGLFFESTSVPSTRACSSNSSCDEELDISTESLGNQQPDSSLAFQAAAPTQNQAQTNAIRSSALSIHEAGLGSDSDESCDEVVLLPLMVAKTALRPTMPAPRQPRPRPTRKASIFVK